MADVKSGQYGLRALFRVTFYCAIVAAILHLLPVAVVNDLGGLTLILLLLTVPSLLTMFAVGLVGWLVERGRSRR